MPEPTAPRLLDGYLTEKELARELQRTMRTLREWRHDKYGPPATIIGRTPYYARASVLKWMENQENAAA
jgi:helix-turn-helix protein